MTKNRAAKIIIKAVEKAMRNPPKAEQQYPRLSTSIRFTPEECENMAEEFKIVFQRTQRTARLIKYEGGGYEIRYRRNGFNVSVFDADLAKAKRLFVQSVTIYAVGKRCALDDKIYHDMKAYPETRTIETLKNHADEIGQKFLPLLEEVFKDGTDEEQEEKERLREYFHNGFMDGQRIRYEVAA